MKCLKKWNFGLFYQWKRYLESIATDCCCNHGPKKSKCDNIESRICMLTLQNALLRTSDSSTAFVSSSIRLLKSW